jgi:hypothetical protein
MDSYFNEINACAIIGGKYERRQCGEFSDDQPIYNFCVPPSGVRERLFDIFFNIYI